MLNHSTTCYPPILMTLFSALVFSSAVAVAHEHENPGIEAFQAEVGSWDAEVKTWMTPDGDPEITTGSEEIEMMGSNWLISNFYGQALGQPFRGIGQLGYDATKKKFVGTWIDTLTPGLSLMQGDYDGETKTFTYFAKSPDPASGEQQLTKMVSQIIDENHKSFKVFVQLPEEDGAWWQQMEIQYTRKQ